MSSLRILLVGGWTSYRALFGWLSPWILIPTFVIEPIFQVLFFASVGRSAGVGTATFFLIGNAVQFASIPCLFAMSNTIGGERNSGTLSLLLVSPARRIPLFVGRAMPVIVNGFAVTLLTLAVGAVVLDVPLPPSTWLPLTLVVGVCAFSCTGLGLMTAGLAMRVRETAVLSNVFFGILMIFCGVNVPLSAMPSWMGDAARALPLTHGIAAARGLAAGAGWAEVRGLVGTEALIGTSYLVIGLVLLSYFEAESRRRATLELA
jgi:ABC-2 type transport system permease protein